MSSGVVPDGPSSAPHAHQAPVRSGEEAAHHLDQRSPFTVGTGRRLFVLLGLLLLVAAGYFLLSPVQVLTNKGQQFGCGSGLNPPDTQFSKGICGSAPSAAVAKSVAFAVAGVMVAGGGFLVFRPSGPGMAAESRRERRWVED